LKIPGRRFHLHPPLQESAEKRGESGLTLNI
jgi:hypothetical protein